MKNSHIYKITFFVLILFVFVIVLFGVIYYRYFIHTKNQLKNRTFIYLLKDVKNITQNIERYTKDEYGDIKITLEKKPQMREKYNRYLSSFITINYKNLFIVYKDRNSKFFRALADGAVNPNDRFDFEEKFEPKFYMQWIKVLKTKKPLFYRSDITGLWTTYLYPVLKNDKVEYIIVIDFSTKPLDVIEKNLKSLKNLFVLFMVIIIVIIVILSVFIVYDYFRQKRMRILFDEINKLNKELKKRVEEEVKKSREKDRQLIMQSRMALMGELLSMIAHQWRQPLNVLGSIVSNMELDVNMGMLDKNSINEYTKKLKTNIKYLSATIDDFRKFYKEDTIKTEVNMKKLIEEIVAMIEPSVQSKKIKLEIKGNCGKDIKILKNELKQVILNLIKNAEDAITENDIKDGKIVINIFEEKGKCIIEVKDNAGGVDNSIKDKIFDPYFTTKNEKNGTGLGLYMSKIIVEKKLNGAISEYNDKEGAVFRIELEVDNGSN